MAERGRPRNLTTMLRDYAAKGSLKDLDQKNLLDLADMLESRKIKTVAQLEAALRDGS